MVGSASVTKNGNCHHHVCLKLTSFWLHEMYRASLGNAFPDQLARIRRRQDFILLPNGIHSNCAYKMPIQVSSHKDSADYHDRGLFSHALVC